jgi:hypothetical protein
MEAEFGGIDSTHGSIMRHLVGNSEERLFEKPGR